MADAERVRVDVWLWSVRVFRTRSAANDACRTGRVRVGDNVAKPATKVGPGDHVSVRVAGRRRQLRVDKTLTKRVGAALVDDYMTDLDPQPAAERSVSETFEPLAGVRDRGAGRPTKRDRRRLDRLKRG